MATNQPQWAPGVKDVPAIRGRRVRMIYKESARSRKWKASSLIVLEYDARHADQFLAIARQNGWHAVSARLEESGDG